MSGNGGMTVIVDEPRDGLQRSSENWTGFPVKINTVKDTSLVKVKNFKSTQGS